MSTLGEGSPTEQASEGSRPVKLPTSILHKGMCHSIEILFPSRTQGSHYHTADRVILTAREGLAQEHSHADVKVQMKGRGLKKLAFKRTKATTLNYTEREGDGLFRKDTS